MAADIAGGRELAFAVLSGPSFAHDVARRMPTAVVIASQDQASAAAVQEALATPYFRTYTSQDVVGVEIGGALKNVIAVASGIVEGLGLGHNTRAALITRGLAEIMRLGVFLGADPLTFSGLSGHRRSGAYLHQHPEPQLHVSGCSSARGKNWRISCRT